MYIKPMHELKFYLEQMVEIRKTMPKPPKLRYNSLEEFILKHGKPFAKSQRPKKYKRGTPKYCYHNSTMLALRNDELLYVEGVAVNSIGLPISHAWCCKIGDDKAIDITSDDFLEYFGVAFQTEYVATQTHNGEAILDNWQKEWPLLQMNDEQLAHCLA